MFDLWMGDVELTTLVLLVSVAVLLPLQLLLCFRVRSRLVRLLPVLLLSMAALCCVVGALAAPGWDGLGYLMLAMLAGIMLLLCLAAWGIWAVIRLLRRRRGRGG